MTKSEFYIIWYSNRGYELSENGYPMVPYALTANHDDDDPNYIPTEEEITGSQVVITQDDWNKFLETEEEVSALCRMSSEACEIAGVTFEQPYEISRIYPDIGDQLDNIYKTLKTLKDAGTDLGAEGNAYIDSITAIKETYPKN